jgi:preprotein translocase subunit YajC
MGNWFSTALLAVEEIPTAAPAGEAAGKAADGGGMGGILVLLLPAVLIMLLMQFMGNNPRKQAQQQLDKLKNLKKNDPVVTIGGIRGSFVSLSEDGTEVTLQLNDNLRVRFDASAIRSVPPLAAPPKS